MGEPGKESQYDLIIIGGGAAGFFAAINYTDRYPGRKVMILEKTAKLLSKVRISGGGRCNVTNACFDIRELTSGYPRGEKELTGPMMHFGPLETMEWFENRGVRLKTEEDRRVFPVSDDSSDIVNCLLDEARRNGVDIRTNMLLKDVRKTGSGFLLDCESGERFNCRNLLAACGGSPNPGSYEWIRKLGHSIVPPVPSLFTFNLTGEKVTGLMGLSCSDAEVYIPHAKFKSRGPVLITHWGLSGPAVLRLSSLAARALSGMNYRYEVQVNWVPEHTSATLKEWMESERKRNASKFISSTHINGIPRRLWMHLIAKSGIPGNMKWGELSKIQGEKTCQLLRMDEYAAAGKTTFKDEFVTCGGVERKEIDFKTMQSKTCPGLYFSGEVIDIDGITGGYNFQNAWTTAWIVSQNIKNK